MRLVGYAIAYLAAIVIGWAVPLLGVALLLLPLQFVFLLQPFLAAGVQVVLAGLLMWYSLNRSAIWQAIAWGLLWGIGAFTAVLGKFHWYVLIIEAVLLVVLAIPGVVDRRWLNALRWFAIGEITFALILLYQREVGVSVVAVVTAVLLGMFATFIGTGTFRPFEARRFRRQVATFAILAAVALLFWQPVILPVTGVVSTALRSTAEGISTSPVWRWYTVVSLQAERREIGERTKTEALRQSQDQLTDAHRQRWEKAVEEIPNFPLAPNEWEELGVPR